MTVATTLPGRPTPSAVLKTWTGNAIDGNNTRRYIGSESVATRGKSVWPTREHPQPGATPGAGHRAPTPNEGGEKQ